MSANTGGCSTISATIEVARGRSRCRDQRGRPEGDEWFEESDDLVRLARAIQSVGDEGDPVVAAGKLAFRVTHAQAFVEGNKRTALLLARWLLDHNGVDGETILPVDDEALGDLLVKAASGVDVEPAIIELLTGRQ